MEVVKNLTDYVESYYNKIHISELDNAYNNGELAWVSDIKGTETLIQDLSEARLFFTISLLQKSEKQLSKPMLKILEILKKERIKRRALIKKENEKN